MCHFIYKILFSFLTISFGEVNRRGQDDPDLASAPQPSRPPPASAPRRGKVAGMTYRTTALRGTGPFTSSSASLSLPTPAGRHLRP